MKVVLEPLLNWGKQSRYELMITFFVGFLLIITPTIYANASTADRRFNLGQNIPPRKIGLVFGAGVYKDGSPTPYLRWRIETAVQLYNEGTISKILVSGDNSSKHYDEPTAMKKYAVSLGVPANDVVVDYAGFNTYDSCYRAKHIFGVNEAIVVTQGYHLPRAVMTCQNLGIDTVGVAAKKEFRDFTVKYILREYLSTAKAIIQLQLKPKPMVLGKPEPINF